ncbi:prohead protease [Clostridium baratii]|uniref:prohead protease n=1 Tax=Clostridium baratii TaxID=1561 RepID=UPI0030D36D10
MKINTNLIKEKIFTSLNSEEILKYLPDKKVFFIHAPKATAPYVEYMVINSKPSDYSEGNINYINHTVQIDIFSYEDYSEIETTIINRMLECGFDLEAGIPDLYEEKTGLLHKPIRLNIDLEPC